MCKPSSLLISCATFQRACMRPIGPESYEFSGEFAGRTWIGEGTSPRDAELEAFELLVKSVQGADLTALLNIIDELTTQLVSQVKRQNEKSRSRSTIQKRNGLKPRRLF
jgi:hypothetical protein